MATQTQPSKEERAPLSREKILMAAVEVADESGIEALTMRNLAAHLGVEAMSLYYHVENKEDLLDGVVEVIVGEILEAVGEVDPALGKHDWKAALRNRILTARAVLLRHRWAPAVIEQRTKMSPGIIYYYEGVLAILRAGGFSYDVAHHAVHALGSRALGFTQELFQPADTSDEEASEEMLQEMAESLPYLVEMLTEIAHEDPDSTIGWCDDQTEFEFGLDLLLDGLERMNTAV